MHAKDTWEQQWQAALENRRRQGRYRELIGRRSKLEFDFLTNDYLGLANDPAIQHAIVEQIERNELAFGASGSRLLGGNRHLHQELEQTAARFHKAEAGLLFPSGYQANLGLLATLADRHTTYIADEFIHASLREGIRLSSAKHFRFRHNNLEDLEAKLKRAQNPSLVITEAVFSMDGDSPALGNIARLCEQYGAGLVVDEAHSAGILGPHGAGLCVAQGIHQLPLARIVTFGKAFGSAGAIVLGSENLIDFLRNFSRPFIYSTAPPPAMVVAILQAYRLMPEIENKRKPLYRNKTQLENWLNDLVSGQEERLKLHSGKAAILSLQTGSEATARQLEQTLLTAGFGVRSVLPPTVPEGAARIRFCLHSYNSLTAINSLGAALFAFFDAEQAS